MTAVLDWIGWLATATFASSYFCKQPAALRRVQALAALLWIGYGALIRSLPVVVAKRQPLVFRAWRPGDPLEAGVFGTLHPAPTREAVEPDALIVPLLACDEEGWRLGYGGGFYDRTLAELRKLKPVTAIGVAYAEQEMDEVPVAPYDQPLDWILTERGVIEPKR